MATVEPLAAQADATPRDAQEPDHQRDIEQRTSSMIGSGDDGEDGRGDPDAQTTVNDFLDFTEYLPSDMMRSLTLIESLDEAHADSSLKLHELTKMWSELPNQPANERPTPTTLRADISEQMNQALSSRIYAHAEAVRMAESVNRHYNKAMFLQAKLQAMMDNWPTEEQQALSPVASKSPQLSRSKLRAQAGADGTQKVRQKRAPLVTVPGEVLAPYDIEYETVTEGSDASSDDEGTAVTVRRTPAPGPKIKVISTAKPSSKPPARPSNAANGPSAEQISANQAALLKPPPPDAEIGGPHAPWLQLTHHELARLRKRMKKNATWVPSETMILRELRELRRGPEHYQEAKQKMEEEGKAFDAIVPVLSDEDGSGTMQLPVGAISVESVVADELPSSNKGMKLNEAKKLKREALAKMAAEDAEESAKKMAATAKLFLEGNNGAASPSASETAKETGGKAPKPRTNSRSNAKRKRDTEGDAGSEPPEETDTPSTKPVVKRSKTETPVPPPQYGKPNHVASTSEASNNQPQTTQSAANNISVPPIETPVPLPFTFQNSAGSSMAGLAKSPTPNGNGSASGATTTIVPIKLPATETPVPLPRSSERRKSITPVAPHVRDVPAPEGPKRETRADAAKRSQQQVLHQDELKTEPQASGLNIPEGLPSRRASSRGTTPAKSTPAPEVTPSGRPGSRGKAMSQEPQSSLAMDRPRRASTARNTPAPEPRPPSRRSKRPAPGVIKTTKSGGNSAVGKRKTAPKKKPRAKKGKDQQVEDEEEDVDDEGNPIDPNEPRYCTCKNYSYGTMIQCDNVDVSC